VTEVAEPRRVICAPGPFVTPTDAVMVTPYRMSQFAAECRRWSEDDTSQRDLMIRIAKQWMTTATAIERSLASGGQLAASDLRKLH